MSHPVASLHVDLTRDADGWIAHDTRTGAVVHAPTWAEALWAVRVAGANATKKEK